MVGLSALALAALYSTATFQFLTKHQGWIRLEGWDKIEKLNNIIGSRNRDLPQAKLSVTESPGDTAFSVIDRFKFSSTVLTVDDRPITVTSWSKAWTTFAYSNCGVVSSNDSRGIDVCCASSVCVVAALGRADLPSKESHQLFIRLRNLRGGRSPTRGLKSH
jgi:hypothetical protein